MTNNATNNKRLVVKAFTFSFPEEDIALILSRTGLSLDDLKDMLDRDFHDRLEVLLAQATAGGKFNPRVWSSHVSSSSVGES